MKNGYYSDDGESIDLNSMTLPDLCSKCRKVDQKEEEMLCNLNRIDQRKEIAAGKKFRCEAFEAK